MTAEAKRVLRAQLLVARRGYSRNALQARSRIIVRTVLGLDEIAKATTVASYVGKEGEVETAGIVGKLLARGKRVLVSVTDRKNHAIVFSELRGLDELAPGTFGILEPKPNALRPRALDEAHVIIVPGVAWDERGFRLGYGKGYFDAALAALDKPVPLIGLAFEFQIVPRIPEEHQDIPVDMLVSDRRTIKCRKQTPVGS
jgi:5-formyltetrahydrofolate cyclo-ligase